MRMRRGKTRGLKKLRKKKMKNSEQVTSPQQRLRFPEKTKEGRGTTRAGQELQKQRNGDKGMESRMESRGQMRRQRGQCGVDARDVDTALPERTCSWRSHGKRRGAGVGRSRAGAERRRSRLLQHPERDRKRDREATKGPDTGEGRWRWYVRCGPAHNRHHPAALAPPLPRVHLCLQGSLASFRPGMLAVGLLGRPGGELLNAAVQEQL